MPKQKMSSWWRLLLVCCCCGTLPAISHPLSPEQVMLAPSYLPRLAKKERPSSVPAAAKSRKARMISAIDRNHADPYRGYITCLFAPRSKNDRTAVPRTCSVAENEPSRETLFFKYGLSPIAKGSERQRLYLWVRAKDGQLSPVRVGSTVSGPGIGLSPGKWMWSSASAAVTQSKR